MNRSTFWPYAAILTSILAACGQTTQQELFVNDFSPSWSPDGSTITFASRRGFDETDLNSSSNDEIYIMNLDGTNEIQLTDNDFSDTGPSWSPDGSRLAFVSDRDGDNEIYIMNPDGTNIVQLTHNNYNDGEIPSWFPDGSQIVFYSNRTGVNEIFVMDADGSNQRQLTDSGGQYRNQNPHVSPDGTKIAFASTRDGNLELYVMNTDGTEQKRLTRNETYDNYPMWSPDGKTLVYICFPDPGGDVCAIGFDGSDARRLTDTPDWDFDPAFSPDGQKIVFDSRRDGRRGIYVMNADGSKQVKLTHHLNGRELTSMIRSEGLKAAKAYFVKRRKQIANVTLFSELAMTRLAKSYFEKGNDEEAIEIYELILTAYPSSGAAHRDLADYHSKHGNSALAQEHYRRSLALNPNNLTVLDKFGFKQALDLFAALVETGKLNESRMNRLGYSLLNAGRIDEATEIFMLNVRAFPQSANVYDSLGEAYLKAGEKELAIQNYERSVELNPNNTHAVAILERLMASGGN